MARRDFDLNLEPEPLTDDLDLNVPIDWDGIEELDGPAHELDYNLVCHDGGDEDGDGHGHGTADAGDANTEDALLGAGDGDGGAPASSRESAASEGVQYAGQEGETVKKRRFYSDDLKIAIYLELLAKTHPPVLHHGVSREVALKFGVPQKLVQRVWRKGQDYGGIHGVKNKLSSNCGRKKIEIDMEAMNSVPPSERTTFKDLANALGVKKSTLYSRYKEGYFRRHTN